MTKRPCRHKEMWWWNEDVAVAVREKEIMYGKWKKENRKRQGDKMRRELSLQQRKRNRRNAQMT